MTNRIMSERSYHGATWTGECLRDQDTSTAVRDSPYKLD